MLLSILRNFIKLDGRSICIGLRTASKAASEKIHHPQNLDLHYGILLVNTSICCYTIKYQKLQYQKICNRIYNKKLPLRGAFAEFHFEILYHLDLDIDSSRKIQVGERFDNLLARI